MQSSSQDCYDLSQVSNYFHVLFIEKATSSISFLQKKISAEFYFQEIQRG